MFERIFLRSKDYYRTVQAAQHVLPADSFVRSRWLKIAVGSDSCAAGEPGTLGVQSWG